MGCWRSGRTLAYTSVIAGLVLTADPFADMATPMPCSTDASTASLSMVQIHVSRIAIRATRNRPKTRANSTVDCPPRRLERPLAPAISGHRDGPDLIDGLGGERRVDERVGVGGAAGGRRLRLGLLVDAGHASARGDALIVGVALAVHPGDEGGDGHVLGGGHGRSGSRDAPCATDLLVVVGDTGLPGARALGRRGARRAVPE